MRLLPFSHPHQSGSSRVGHPCGVEASMLFAAVLSLLLHPTGSLLLRPTAAPAALRTRCAVPVAIDFAADSVASPLPCAPEKCETACDKDAPPRMARVPKAITSQPVARSPDAAPAIERVAGPRTASLPPPDDLADEVMLRIVMQEMTDTEVNALAWKYLGYHFQEATGTWDASAVFPNWRQKFPQPPDLVGVTRKYEREIDEPVLRAVQSLQQSVAKEHKNNLRAFLKPLGWNGYKMDGLTPNMTRRAQVANWLLYYREALHGVPVEELRRRREVRAAEEAARKAAGEVMAPTGTAAQSVI